MVRGLFLRTRFNGATTKASWKARFAWLGSRRPSGFNGATTKASWKAFNADKFFRRLRALQWGHDEGVVEGQAVQQ